MAKESGNKPPSSLLSTKQRNRLSSDESGLEAQKGYSMKSRIRKRLRWGIYDFALLYDNWDNLGLDKVFGEQKLDRHLGQEGVERAFATLYRGLFTGYIPFEPLLRAGVARAEMDMHTRPARVQFSVDPLEYHGTSINQAADKVNPESVRDLRVDEMRAIVEALAYSDEDIPELVREGFRKKHLGDVE